MNKRKIITALLIILILATLAFIWGNSLRSIPESDAESKKVLGVIEPFLEFFVGKGNVTNHLVRKIAHFLEYAALGLELAALMKTRRFVSLQGVSNCLFAGLLAAVIDESLQLLSDRGSLLTDVLLDFGGVAAGIAVILIIHALSKPKKRRALEK